MKPLLAFVLIGLSGCADAARPQAVISPPASIPAAPAMVSDPVATWDAATQGVRQALGHQAVATVATRVSALTALPAGPTLHWYPQLGVVVAEERRVDYGSAALVAPVRLTGDDAAPFAAEVMVPSTVTTRTSAEIPVSGANLPESSTMAQSADALPMPTAASDPLALPEQVRAPAQAAIAACRAATGTSVSGATVLTLRWQRANASFVITAAP